jgi:hypothetical protein
MSRLVSDKGELLVFIQDTRGAVFGGCMTQSFSLRNSFFGTGDAFVFKVIVR